MASLYVAEFTLHLIGNIQGMQVALAPAKTHQKLTITGTTGQSNAFDGATGIIRVHTDAICSIEIGADPTATTSTMRLAANQTEYFGVKPGDKIAVISNT